MSSSEEYSSSDLEEYETCCSQRRESSSGLVFDPAALEKIILLLSDKFDFRVVMSEERTRNAMLVTSGLTLAGTIIGKHYGGKFGAAVGSAVGGACGIGIVAISMRDIWEDIRSKVSELFDVAFDYLAGLGMHDYQAAAQFFVTNHTEGSQLAKILLEVASNALKKKITSSLTQ